jgi:DNA-binding response OmpR family regulator
MIHAGAKQKRPLAPFLRRVLLLDASHMASRLTAEVLKDLGAAEIYTETSDAKALAVCREVEPQLIVTELSGPTLDGLKFVRQLRRSNLVCRARPVIVITHEPTAASIIAARNSGVHEFLCKPFTIRDIVRRIEAVALHKRDWIEAVNYVGPDRRRFNSGDYQGRRRRQTDAPDPGPAVRIEQALRIIVSAIRSVESDPGQSLRAMQAQADDLRGVAEATGDAALMEAAAQLQRCLTLAVSSGVLSRVAVEGGAKDLLARLPAEPLPAFELA